MLAARHQPRSLGHQRYHGSVHRSQVVCRSSSSKFFVGGNWKCNGTQQSIKQLVSELNGSDIASNVDVVCAPPFVYLLQVKDSLDPAKFQVAAQNAWYTGTGAYTGEVAADMLVDMGIPWVILGHSERRQYFDESNEFVGEKCAHALEMGLGIIACVGENLDQRNNGHTFDVVEAQLAAIADHVSDWSKVVIAYEPVWAIGTGKVATPDQAQEVHSFLRRWFVDNVDPDVASQLRIIYGGSVNSKNSGDLAKEDDIDGFLVGGASLKAADFVAICNSAL